MERGRNGDAQGGGVSRFMVVAWVLHVPAPYAWFFGMMSVGMRHGGGRELYGPDALVLLAWPVLSITAAIIAVVRSIDAGALPPGFWRPYTVGPFLVSAIQVLGVFWWGVHWWF